MDPPLTTREVASQAAAVLPGARVRRLLFWRYLLVWQKPIRPGIGHVPPFTTAIEAGNGCCGK